MILNSGLIPQAIFLDIDCFPDNKLRNILETLRIDNNFKNLKVIAYSSARMLTDDLKAKISAAGVNDFVVKTGNLPALKDAMTRSLGLK